MTGLESLASVRRDYIPMAPSTALAFAILGAVLLFRGRRFFRRPVPETLLAIVAVVAAGKLLEFFSGVSLGVEEKLVADPAMFGAVQKGRMSPITALNFLLICGAIFGLSRPPLRRWTGRAAIASLVISFVVVLGYIHGTPLLYGGHIIPVALPTAAAFVLLTLGVVAGAGPNEWPLRALLGDSAKAVLLRWFLSSVIVVALAEGFLRTKFLTQWDLNPALSSALSTLIYTLLVTAVISEVAQIVGGRIDRAETERNAAQADLEALNRDLEKKVSKRTRELSVKNQQMEEELTMARELQLALLPNHFPSVPASAPPSESAFQFFSIYYPAGAVSGDFFSIFPISDSGVGIFICDVMGHGVRAALVTSMMRALLEQHSGTEPDPGRLLTQINHGLNSILKNVGTTMYATAVMLIVDAARAELLHANAGHPRPLHVRRDNGETVPLEINGRRGALGLFPNAEFSSVRTKIAPGDLIMVFTDGLFEIEDTDGEFYSQEHLLEAVRKHSTLPTQRLFEQVISGIHTFADRSDFDDDVCVVGIEVVRCLDGSEDENSGAAAVEGTK
jgi:serine phosphatase RsbU (regulator of sigma subunit)